MVDTPICITNRVICVCMASLHSLFLCCWHFHCHRDFWKATKAILNYLFSSRKLLLLPCMIPGSFKMDNVLYHTQIAMSFFMHKFCCNCHLYGVLLPYPWCIWASQDTDYHIIRHIGPPLSYCSQYTQVPPTCNKNNWHHGGGPLYKANKVFSFFFFVFCLL